MGGGGGLMMHEGLFILKRETVGANYSPKKVQFTFGPEQSFHAVSTETVNKRLRGRSQKFRRFQRSVNAALVDVEAPETDVSAARN